MAVDPVKVDPKHYKVAFENDKVRILRIRYGPREKSAMHGYPEGVLVFLTDCDGKFTYPDGKMARRSRFRRRLARPFGPTRLNICRRT